MKEIGLATAAAFTALLSTASANYISVIAARSASPIHLLPINAAGERLWIGKETAAYCPDMVKQESNCPDGVDTNFAFMNGLLEMGTEVPGGQLVYIDPECGAVGYTEPHSASMPPGAIISGWELDQGSSYGFLSWANSSTGAGGLVACSAQGNSTRGPWQIFAEIPGAAVGPSCIGFDMLTTNESTPAAWEYE